MICKYCGSSVPDAACNPKDAIALPPELDTEAFREAWAEWVAFRREKKQTLKPTSIKRQIAFLVGLGVSRAIDSIEMSIRSGWTGLFEPQEAKATGKKADPERDAAILAGHYRPSSGVAFDRDVHRRTEEAR